MTAAAVLETEALGRRFGALEAVRDMSLAVGGAEVFGLLGPNGAGKTTVIKMLTTLLPPTAGRAVINGFDIHREKAGVRRSIGYVSQLLSSDGALTGYENLLISAKLYDLPRRQRQSGWRMPWPSWGLERRPASWSDPTPEA